MKKEYDVVMLGSLIKRTDEEDSILNKAIEEGVNWIEVGGILLNHRLSGYFYNNFWVNVFPCWYKRGGLSQSRRLPPLQVVSNSKFVSVGVGSPTEINAPRGCAVIL